MRKTFIFIVALFVSNAQAASTNYIETAVYGLTFSYPSHISVSNSIETGEFGKEWLFLSFSVSEYDVELISFSSSDTFHMSIGIFTNLAGESMAKTFLGISRRLNAINPASNDVSRTILGIERNGKAATPLAPLSILSSEEYMFKDSGAWFLFNIFYASPRDDKVRDAILSSMKYSRPERSGFRNEKKGPEKNGVSLNGVSLKRVKGSVL